MRFFAVLWYSFVTPWSYLRLWRHCWRRQWLGRVHYTDYEWDLCLDSCPICLIFLLILYTTMEGIKNGCPCIIIEISCTKDCALATFLHLPTSRAGSPTKAQPCVFLISTIHGQPFLTHLTNKNKNEHNCAALSTNTWTHEKFHVVHKFSDMEHIC